MGDASAAHPSEPPRFVLRMSSLERWQHALLALSFIVLVYTGFALKFPESWPFTWLVALETGYAWRAWVHRGAAVVMILACLLHVAYLPTRRGRAHISAMLPRLSDVKEVLHNIRYLVGLRSEPPRFDRFSYIEKAEYWAVVWGSVVMVITGFVLWFENRHPAAAAAVGCGPGHAGPLLRGLARHPGDSGLASLLRDLQPGRLPDELDLAYREDLGDNVTARAPARVRAVARAGRAGRRPRRTARIGGCIRAFRPRIDVPALRRIMHGRLWV